MAASSKEEIFFLKSKIKELEAQVSSYKRKHDELRKAKNTTVLKREREILEVGAPNLGQRRDVGDQNVSKLQKEMSELKLKHVSEIKELEDSVPKETKCDHEELIQCLKKRIDDLESENSVLVLDNGDLRERVESLYLELSMKEAQWCETEEELNLKLKTQWSEKYRVWMEQTETKLAELQEANNLMRTLLKKQKPKEDDS